MTANALSERGVEQGDKFAPAVPLTRGVHRRSVVAGVAAVLAMAAFYIAVVRGASGSWAHLQEQARTDWAYLLFIVTGFGAQVMLMVELKHRHRLNRASRAAGGAGAGASTVGMVACCAHHLADLLPVLGATGAATFLTDQRIPVMLLGITITAVGVVIAARRLHRLTTQQRAQLTATTPDPCANG
ncbi:MAG: hypothetical protein ACKV2O_07930 [Acidimicrobiales bacterium]